MSPNRLRTLPWVLGVCLLAASLLGANRLLHPTDAKSPAGGDGGGKHAPTVASPALPGGTVVLGTVDSDPSPVQVGPPSVAGVSTVEKVFVTDGQEVKVGDQLVQFEDKIAQAKLRQAQAELAAAEDDRNRAEVQRKLLTINVERQKAAIKAAEEELRSATEIYNIGVQQYEEVLAAERNFTTSQPLSEAEKQKKRNENLELRRGAHTLANLKVKVEDERKKLAALELTPVEIDYRQAQKKVERLQATVDEAQAYVEGFLIRAKIAGVVEQITAAPGTTYGPSSRAALMWLVPAGTRVVRAEVEAEFAYKIADKIGKPVTVYDHNNFALTYPGVVKRIGTTYLTKRSSNDTLTVNPSKVLECLIEVTDPAPAGKPPLRVGQPVRVSFP